MADIKPLYSLIGDKLKISHWDNEVEFTIEFKDKVKKHLVTNEIADGEGGYEYDVVLEEKPNKNTFDFDITSKELNFFYQPALTQQEIDEGAQRPENVIGSYAVYHKTKTGHRIGDKNYMAGKAFHIYRPKIIDANGAWVWGDLDIQGNKLTVTVPQQFLDDAVYPVTIKG
jgi:hypothetical protein